MKFTKMQGIGNDYIYFDCTAQPVEHPEELAVKLSDRHFGVGGDGIVLILPSACADFRMRMFNADGSEGKMCGNASRCIGKYVFERGLTDRTDLTLETLSGVKHLHLTVENGKVARVAVDMGRADFAADRVPVIFNEDEVVEAPFTVNGTEWRITCVSMGNPHCVIFCDDPAALKLEEIGPMFEHAPIFPERINTEFVRLRDAHTLEMRVWERGSGETMACGTGACASAAAAVRTGRCAADEWITVKLRGGDLRVRVAQDGGVTMEGPAEFVFDGEL